MTTGTNWRPGGVWLLSLLAGCVAPTTSAREGSTEPAEPAAVAAVSLAADLELAPPAPSPLLEPAIQFVSEPPTLAPVTHVIGSAHEPATIDVAVGQQLRFVNHDAICHGLFSSSAPNTFDLGFLRPGAGATVSFAHPGVVHVYCSLHEHCQLTIRVAADPR
ncbi:MAG TPA: hypothetical protein VFZ65_15160 [Planctomycetota bacterium]|nr:hypothetical protein [Planctomycetota bacterium]